MRDELVGALRALRSTPGPVRAAITAVSLTDGRAEKPSSARRQNTPAATSTPTRTKRASGAPACRRHGRGPLAPFILSRSSPYRDVWRLRTVLPSNVRAARSKGFSARPSVRTAAVGPPGACHALVSAACIRRRGNFKSVLDAFRKPYQAFAGNFHQNATFGNPRSAKGRPGKCSPGGNVRPAARPVTRSATRPADPLSSRGAPARSTRALPSSAAGARPSPA
jgi:hypothetical protein